MLDSENILAKKDRRLLFKDNTFLIILAIFILMTIASTYIGWSSEHTITRVYDETAKELLAAGKPVPSSPFVSTPPLAIIQNMIIYVILIGALLSITLGHIISINDRKAGVTRILFSKPFSKKTFFLGKILSSLQILLIVLLFSFIVSIISILILGSFSIQSFTGLLIFYIGSFIYLAGFTFLGLFFGLKTKNSTQAILIPLLIWIVITFALPELGSALYPTSSLNPILPQTNILDSPILSTMHNIIYPFSISEQYKEFSSNALGLTSNALPTNITPYSQEVHLLLLSLWFLLILGLVAYAVKKYDASEGDNYE